MSNTLVIPYLKYLFTAKYKNGSEYKQNWQDISINEPTKRSCFYDVEQDKVVSFTLVGDNKIISVYLNDGHFEINDVPFFMHDTGLDLKDFRLIFYRQHEHKFNIGLQELSHDIKYCIGWQTNDANGNNIKRIMEVI